MIPTAQIRLEKYGIVKDGNGNAVESINSAYNRFAEVVRTGGFRSDSNGQTKLNNSIQFKVRFRPDWKISGMWKLIYNGSRYSITQIQRLNERRFNWIINCESPTTIS